MEPAEAPIAQKTVELSTAIVVEANEKRIVLQINNVCHLVVLTHGYLHDHKVGEVVPLLAILRITKDGSIIRAQN